MRLRCICVGCGATIAFTSDLVFYLGIHLIARPETARLPRTIAELLESPPSDITLTNLATGPRLSIHRERDEKRSRFAPFVVACPCGHDIGTIGPLGPDSEPVLALGAKNVRIDHPGLPAIKSVKAAKWKLIIPQLPAGCLTARDINTFANAAATVPSFPGSDTSVVLPTDTDQFSPWNLTRTRPRGYQREAFISTCIENNLVALPTGTGKTLVAVMVICRFKQLNPTKAAVFLADRIPLVYQQKEYFERESKMRFRVEAIVGETFSSKKIKEIAAAPGPVVLFMIDTVFLNCIKSDLLSLSQFSCLVIDEAHHATGSHGFSHVLDRISSIPLSKRPRVLAMSASPTAVSPSSVSSDLSILMNCQREIADLCERCCRANVFAPRCFADEFASVMEARGADVEWRCVGPSAVEVSVDKSLRGHWSVVVSVLVDVFSTADISGTQSLGDALSKPEINVARGALNKLLSFDSNSPHSLWTVILNHADWIFGLIGNLSVLGSRLCSIQLSRYDIQPVLAPMDMHHALALSSSYTLLLQSVAAYGTPTSETHSPRTAALIADLREALHSASADLRIIVFVRSRETARSLLVALDCEHCRDLAFLKPTLFVGHSGFDGMQWHNEQELVMKNFRKGLTRCLIATSVAEEGIDIPTCNLVIRFDGVVDVRSLIQSRGRARDASAKFIVYTDDIQQQEVMASRESILLQAIKALATENSRVQQLLEHFKEPPVDDAAMREVSKDEVAHGGSGREDVIDGDIVVRIIWDGRAGDLDALFHGAMIVVCHDETFDIVHLRPLSNLGGEGSQRIYEEIVLGRLNQAGAKVWVRPLRYSDFRDSDGAKNDLLSFSEVGRGWFSGRCTFIKASNIMTADGGLEGWVNMLASHGSLIFESLTLRMEVLLSTIDHALLDVAGAIILALNHPPLFYRSQTTLDEVVWVRIPWDLDRKSLVFRFILAEGKDESVRRRLRVVLSGLSVEVWDLCLSTVADFVPQHTQRSLPTMTDDISYLLTCFQSRWMHLLPDFTDLSPDFVAAVANLQSPSVQQMALESFKPTFFRNIMDEFRIHLGKNKRLYETSLKLSTTSVLNHHHAMIRHATVTPTRVIYHRPTLMLTNRMLRSGKLAPQDAIIVSFLDEHGQPIPASSQVWNRISSILERGLIVSTPMGESVYRMLGSSGSQFRNGKAWFARNCDVDALRYSVGVSSIRTPGKYVARLGMAFSATYDTVSVPSEAFEISNIEDDLIADDGSLLSDGCGRISSSFAESIWSKLKDCNASYKNMEPATVFQVRVGGCKGVLAVDPLMTGSAAVRFRKSMVKFVSTSRMLEIVSPAINIESHLNRQMIVLLETLGVKPEVFIQLQRQALDSMRLILTDEAWARTALKGNASVLRYLGGQSVLKALVAEGVLFTTEPWFRSLLSSIYFGKAKDIATRARIPIQKGRVLMGVVDVTGSLSHGEVLVQISSPPLEADGCWSHSTLADADSVLVFRNPGLHPGDVRVLSVRKVAPAGLRHLRDCVVFPGSGPTSHPNECSGGDLDGDLYHLIWEESLIPPKTWPAMVISPPATVKVLPHPISQSDIANFFVKNLACNRLGIVANAHMAISDASELGAADPKALHLAKVHAIEVDFPKTETTATIRPDAIPDSFPDFMGSRDGERSTYKSGKALGQLYRMVFDLHQHKIRENEMTRDSDLVVDGYESFLGFASTRYDEFVSSIGVILAKYNIQSEAELVTGFVTVIFEHLVERRGQVVDAAQTEVAIVKDDFRAEFERWSAESTDIERAQKASAWYLAPFFAAKHANINAFSWIPLQTLLKVKRRARNSVEQPLPTLIDRMAFSLRQRAQSCRFEILSDMMERFDAMARIELLVTSATPQLTVLMFGSSILGLSEDASDVDSALSGRRTACCSKSRGIRSH